MELMVGIAIGLIIVAAASLLMSGQLNENRRLLAETQLQQDLRAASDIITRELRRIGADTEGSLDGLWFPGRTAPVVENVYSRPGDITPAEGASASEVTFTYNPGGAGIGDFGYRLMNGGIQTRMFTGGWQELTDPRIMTVNTFTIRRDDDTNIQVPCAKPCPVTNDATCWPKLRIRNLSVSIAASAAADSTISRSIRTKVRVRNDYLGFDPNPLLLGQVCPT